MAQSRPSNHGLSQPCDGGGGRAVLQCGVTTVADKPPVSRWPWRSVMRGRRRSLLFILLSGAGALGVQSGCIATSRQGRTACAGTGAAIGLDGAEGHLTLCEDGRPLARYRVSLGSNGLGKQRPGDKRTPVGTFALDPPRPSKTFGVFIGIQIPPQTGYAVGIHGPHRQWAWAGPLTSLVDWTQGCIATWSREAIDEVAAFVRRHPHARIHISGGPSAQ